MNRADDPFLAYEAPSLVEALAVDSGAELVARTLVTPSVVRLQGFGPDERPLVAGLRTAGGRVVAARSTVLLRQAQVGRDVLVVFEDGNAERPIIIGVIETAPLVRDTEIAPSTAPDVKVQLQVDGEDRVVVQAERELVLRCGAASIVLTRAGKVLIEGAYVLSRSSGYNKIKGAAVDIN